MTDNSYSPESDTESPAAYASQVLPAVPRALGLFDGSEASPTHGCGDRQFWYYRTLTDFPGATWQQPMLGLAVLHNAERADNPYAGDGRILAAARAALAFWCTAQNRDGSFNEWYRNEHSYCPTAFTAAGAAQTVLELGDRIPAVEREAATDVLERAGAWLEGRFNESAMNQNAAAALALWVLWRITGAQRWLAAAEDKYTRLSSAQHDEGWHPEYGGADLGYGTLVLDLLAGADHFGAHDLVSPQAERLAGFLLAASGAGSGYPGRLGSRGTAHVFPYGAEHFARRIPAAAALAAKWRAAYVKGRLDGPEGIDDRYFAYFHFSQFVCAYGRAPTAPPTSSDTPPPVTDLPACGLSVRRHAGWSLTVNTRLGGAAAIETPNQSPVYHLGYELIDAAGARYSSVAWNGESMEPATGDGMLVTAQFTRVADDRPLVRWMVPFQILARALVAGRIAELFQAAVKRRFIGARWTPHFILEREIAVRTDGFNVRDRITRTAGAPAVRTIVPATHGADHSPSARRDWAPAPPGSDWDAEASARRLSDDGTLAVKWAYRVGARGVAVTVTTTT